MTDQVKVEQAPESAPAPGMSSGEGVAPTPHDDQGSDPGPTSMVKREPTEVPTQPQEQPIDNKKRGRQEGGGEEGGELVEKKATTNGTTTTTKKGGENEKENEIKLGSKTFASGKHLLRYINRTDKAMAKYPLNEVRSNE